MSKAKKRIPAILICIGTAALVYFAGYIPFYTYQEEVLHTTREQFFSVDHLVKLLPFVMIVLLAAAGILLLHPAIDRLGITAVAHGQDDIYRSVYHHHRKGISEDVFPPAAHPAAPQGTAQTHQCYVDDLGSEQQSPVEYHLGQ